MAAGLVMDEEEPIIIWDLPWRHAMYYHNQDRWPMEPVFPDSTITLQNTIRRTIESVYQMTSSTY